MLKEYKKGTVTVKISNDKLELYNANGGFRYYGHIKYLDNFIQALLHETIRDIFTSDYFTACPVDCNYIATSDYNKYLFILDDMGFDFKKIIDFNNLNEYPISRLEFIYSISKKKEKENEASDC